MEHKHFLNRSSSLQTVHEQTPEKGFKRINNHERFSLQNFEKYGSCEDFPPPKHCSTPKSKYTKTLSFFQRTVYEKPFKTNSATLTWVEELRTNYAPECMSTLQSKSLFANVCDKVKMLTQLTTKVLKMLHNQTYLIAKEFDHIYRCLECNCISGIYDLVEKLVNHMIFVLTENSNFEHHLDPYYQVLHLIELRASETSISLPDLVWKINALALDFSKRIDILLLNQIKIIVGVLETKQSSKSLLVMLNGLNEVGLQPDHLGNLLARCKGIPTLVKLFETTSDNAVHMITLKLLSVVCCTPSAIKSFKESGGLEILCEMLSANNFDEKKLKEGVLLILQVTGPWLQYKIIPLSKYVASLVSSLTGVVKKTFNPETLLVSAAGLANLSNEELSLQHLVDQGTVSAILMVIRSQGADANVFLKEQATTIILNLSKKSEFRLYLCENRVIPAILCFLKLELSSMTSSLIEAATYRVQYKSALALARLCDEREAVCQIQQLQGVTRLIKLCKDGIERNQQDGIVAASMEALRKIMATNNNLQISLTKKLLSYTKQFIPTR